MKKVKVMLSAIAVFAIVGGALAFKAQKVGFTKICYGDFQSNICHTGALVTIDEANGAQQVDYTLTGNTAQCGSAACDAQTRVTIED